MIEKKCPHCGEVKPSTEFYANKSRKDGLAGYCKECQKELSKEVYKKNYAPKRRIKDIEYYHNRKDQCLKNSKKYRQSRLELLWSLKTPCVKCGEDRKCSIDFHHIDPTVKVVNLSSPSVGKSVILEEVKKCICLCKNCHQEFHYLYGHKPEKPVETLKKYLEEEF